MHFRVFKNFANSKKDVSVIIKASNISQAGRKALDLFREEQPSERTECIGYTIEPLDDGKSVRVATPVWAVINTLTNEVVGVWRKPEGAWRRVRRLDKLHGPNHTVKKTVRYEEIS